MKERTPKAAWAIEKVRVFVGPIKEKPVLMAIAGHCQPDGTGAWCKVESIARDVGRSVRTVQRYIQTLEELGLLTVDRPAAWERRTSRYQVTCCAFSLDELELITGVSGHQLVLPLDVAKHRSETTVSDLWTVLGVRKEALSTLGLLAEDGCQPVTPMGDSLTPMGVSLSPYHGKEHGIQHSSGASHIENGEAEYRRRESNLFWMQRDEERKREREREQVASSAQLEI